MKKIILAASVAIAFAGLVAFMFAKINLAGLLIGWALFNTFVKIEDKILED
jgi:hypothetical protein